MSFNRVIKKHLKKWKNRELKKPLILRGARQVGKTTLINDFAKNYQYSFLLNLERKEDLQYFEKYDNVKDILEALFLAKKIPLEKHKKSLLFIDEIQEYPQAIELLRYFYEDFPQLDIIAAGFLLEFALKEVIRYPVGRIEFLYLYPLNFMEYLEAIDHKLAFKELLNIPIKSTVHQNLLEHFHSYLIIGGMPEVVQTFINEESFTGLARIYESIISTYKEDIQKYSTNASERKILSFLMESAHLYLDKRIKLENFGKSNYKAREIGEAFTKLEYAKIIQLIYPTTELESPLKKNRRKSPRMQFLDSGLVNYALDIQGEMIGVDDFSSMYKGAIISHIITQEIISLNQLSHKLPEFWVRDKAQSSAEVDLVLSYREKVIPIEIKSGKAGTLRSLHQFIDRANHPYAIRIYAGEYKIERYKTPSGTPYILMNLPYYLGTQIRHYIKYFIENHKLEQ